MHARDAWSEMTLVPRSAIALPLPVAPPAGFRIDDPATWPAGPGRFELVGGRLLYMPPCGDDQQQTVADVVGILSAWRNDRPELVLGTNEAGMLLGGEVRAADVAVWRRAELGPTTGGFPRVPPVLAVEVAGRDDTIAMLRDKARWYLEHGVRIVWILEPEARCLLVMTPSGEERLEGDSRVGEQPDLPGLTPRVADMFRQISGR